MKIMADQRRLVYAIIKFLREQLSGGGLSDDAIEGVEVGIQCLEAAFNITSQETGLDVPTGLQEIFQRYLSELLGRPREATPEEKCAAEALKNEGNSHISNQNFSEAVICYSKAIQLDPNNAVYYCNRAAASNKLGKYESAIQDCKTALKYDPSYSKAYGRLGLAYASMNQPQEAVKYYKMASDLEPENESYRSNLSLAEESVRNAPSTSAPFVNLGYKDFFQNPKLLSIASQMLSNPSMQNVMSNILAGNAVPNDGDGVESLLQASQQLARQMETDHPALVEQIRRELSEEQPVSQNRPSGPQGPPPPHGVPGEEDAPLPEPSTESTRAPLLKKGPFQDHPDP